MDRHRAMRQRDTVICHVCPGQADYMPQDWRLANELIRWKSEVDYSDDSKWTVAGLESVGESHAGEDWQPATRLLVLVVLVVFSWIVVGLAAYGAVELATLALRLVVK